MRLSLFTFQLIGAFIVISLSLMGAAIGASTACWRKVKAQETPIQSVTQNLQLFSAALFLDTVLVFYLGPFLVSGSTITHIVLVLLTSVVLVTLPFVFLGHAFAVVFASFRTDSFKIYASDLFGACLGVGVVWVMLQTFHWSPINIIYGLILLCNLVIWILTRKATQRPTWVFITFTLLAGILFFTNLLFDFMRVEAFSTLEPMHGPGRELWRRWDGYTYAYPVVDASVYRSPSRLAPYVKNDKGQASISLIAENYSTNVIRLDETAKNLEWLKYDLTSYAFFFGNKKDALIFGCGAGRDIAAALSFGYQHVTGVEVVPTMVHLVLEKFNDYSGRIYDGHPRVSVTIEDARRFLEKNKKKYDLIQLLWGGSTVAYTSNVTSIMNPKFFLLTKEAFKLYIERLNPGGIIFIPDKCIKNPIALTTLIEAMRESGITEPRDHLMIVDRNENWVIFFKDPIDASVRKKAESIAATYGHRVVSAPWMAKNSLDPLLKLTQTHHGPVKSLTDQSPVLPFSSSGQFISLNSSAGWLIHLTFLTLAITAVAMLLLSYRQCRRAVRDPRIDPRTFLFFGLIGSAYLAAESGFMYKFMLWVGNPFHTFLIIIPLAIFFSGLGSMAGAYFKESDRRSIAALLCCLALLISHFVIGWLYAHFYGASDVNRLLFMGAVIAPNAFLMGLPFPFALSWLEIKKVPTLLAAFYISVDMYFAIIGSILVTYALLLIGTSATLLLGSLLYFLSFLSVKKMGRVLPQPGPDRSKMISGTESSQSHDR